MNDPRTVVERQLAAYNAHDLPAWLATYAEDAEQVLADGTLLARGRKQMEERMRPRFADAHLHAALLNRIVLDETVMDHERITRMESGGPVALEMICVYTVREGHIVRATFAFGTACAARAAT